MTHQALFVQGGGEAVHDEWDNKLVASLEQHLGEEFTVRYPRMPKEDDPNFDRWSKAIEGELAKLDDGAMLVGHSVGGTVLVNTLAQHKPKTAFGGLFLLAAPFIGKGGWPADEFEPRAHLGDDLPAGMPVYVYHGTDDDEVPPDHARLYGKAIPQAIVRTIKGTGHQFDNDLSKVAADIAAITKG